MIDEALEFAAKAHAGQFRKGTKRPYIVHPIETADIVTLITQDEEVICAAILHDTIEDCKGVTAKILKEKFGERVARLVEQESEDKSKTWIERKTKTIQFLKTAPWDVKVIALADKLANLRDIDRGFLLAGDALWKRFRMKNKAALEWYYKGVRDALKDTFFGLPAFSEYCALIDKNFGPGKASDEWRAMEGVDKI